MGFYEEFKTKYKQESTLNRLIILNIAVFLVVNIIYVIFFFFNVSSEQVPLLKWLAVPALLNSLITRPWTVFTYMFLHEGFFHIVFNMLWLYWFGKIFLEYLDSKKLLNVYLVGGLCGAALYLLAYNIFPIFEPSLNNAVLLGASASVIAIVVAISFLVPDYTIYLLFLGPVKLKYIAIFTILIDIVSIRLGNPGGHIAHLGGALFGYFFIVEHRKGRDVTRFFAQMLNWAISLFKRRPKLNVSYRQTVDDHSYNKSKAENQKEVDRILDKISKGGYDSLTKEEKDFLFKVSK